ncbi:MAG: translesion error-prone DNA polymerase V autoproteolytic subunit [Candidatus Adiutrix sp.]|nr:translesion error-prone DNA polymerase V autoproteolytic subunit [Candidatus Adiutrix sp.]
MTQSLYPDIISPAEISGERPGPPPPVRLLESGRPGPARGYPREALDLQRLCLKNPADTYFMKACGDSMASAGIYDGDILVVDRSQEAGPGKVVIAAVDGALTIKRLKKKEQRLFLCPENFDNPNFREIDITGQEKVCIWGVVTYCLHALK